MASSSSSSALAPAFFSQSWKYDVFLSFRGEDTRKNFVDHLYSALVQQGIDTYKDDETLRRGESIDPSLMKAIEESQIAIIVFSENYADSCWCLDELAHIIKCKDTRGLIVMPIFYDVNPSEVRKQKEKYGETFMKLELENKTKVESWRKAIVDATNLAGWEPKNIANGHEAQVIKQIVEKISSRLHLVTSSANENLIGIAARVQGLRPELKIGSSGVHMIGIWGVGGGGKTTLASCVYDEISIKFDGCCFLKNIREESSRHGLEALQEKVISKMGANSDGGRRSLINKRFRHRKVLLVLDDVDQLDQLEALAGSPDWFGEGSRVIITTRDEHLLKAHKVVVHDVSLLKGDEAIELFRKHAHLDSTSVMGDYEQLAKEVVSYAGGLPLALKVLGSCLCDKNIHEWRSALARLEKTPDATILEKLKVSFDGLTKDQKDLFLDIACFFRWKNKDSAMEIFDACCFDPVIGVEELRQKALITISDRKFDMHDLVQEMAYYIVRGEHPNNPEKHTRVWRREDVLRICAMDATMELDMIEAIRFERDYGKASSQPVPPIVANMKNLRWIDWEGDLRSPLPTNFPPSDIRCLMLTGISQKQLWEGYKCLPNLKMLDLFELLNLIMTPNFDGLPNLERFNLSNSPKLKEIHSSFRRLERLVSLSIHCCERIKKFPSITGLEKLETLSFHVCPELLKLSKIQQKMGNLQRALHFNNSGKDVTSHKKSCTNFFDICWTCDHNNLHGDTQVKKPREGHLRLWFFPISLRKLDLRDCNLGDEDISSAAWELPNLQELDLSSNRFSRLNFSLLRLPRLKWLNVSGCRDLVELSELPSSIVVLEANGCTSLETFGDTSNCKWLWKVKIEGAYKIRPLEGNKLLDSMLKGNAIEDHFFNFHFKHQMITKGFVGGLFKGKKFTLRLPHDWYSDFCGFLIHVVTYNQSPCIDIIMKQEDVDEDPPFEPWQGEDDEYDGTTTSVGYVPFSSLRLNACLNSTYSVISFSLRPSVFNSGATNRLGATLVPRKSTDDPVQTSKVATDCSEYSDYRPPFRIRYDSESSIEILWLPEGGHAACSETSF